MIFDILVSHRSMAKWHQERIAQHVEDAAGLAERQEQLAQRLASHEQASSSTGKAAAGPSQSNGNSSSSSKPSATGPSSSKGPAANGPRVVDGQKGRSKSPAPGSPLQKAVVPADVESRPRHKSSKSDGDLAFRAMENGHTLSRTRSHDRLPDPPAQVLHLRERK